MGMKATLINPPRSYLIEPDSQAPMGLLYVAAVLEEEGWDVEYVDLAFQDDIPEADLYGITATSADYPDAVRIAESLKGRDGLVILGGRHVSGQRDYQREWMPLFDSVIFGEGESAIRQIAKLYNPKLGYVKYSYKYPVVEDLDTIPFPARHLLPVQGKNIFAYKKRYWEGETTCLLTMRGCPYKCAFCTAGGEVVRYRSVDNVIAEIEHVIDAYGIREFRLSDDTVTLNKKRLVQLLPRMKECNIYWRASIRAWPLDPEILELMADSGCVELSYGVESGDQRVLDRVCKGVTLEQSANAMKWTKDAGITVRALMIAGLPGETPESAYKTIEFMEETRQYWDIAALTNFVPLPGSPIWNRPSDFGVKLKDIDDYNFYLWKPGKDGEPEMTEIVNYIESEDLSNEQMTKNKRVLRAYFIGLDKVNKG